jgi:hypothetical protein
MRLQDQFIRVFLLPLIFGVLVSITFTIITLFYFSEYFADNKEYINQIKDIESQKVIPFIESSRILLYRKFQRSVNSLNIIADYYEFYAKNLNNSINDTLVKKYGYNALYLADNQDKEVKYISRNNNQSYLSTLHVI